MEMNNDRDWKKQTVRLFFKTFGDSRAEVKNKNQTSQRYKVGGVAYSQCNGFAF